MKDEYDNLLKNKDNGELINNLKEENKKWNVNYYALADYYK